MSKTRIGLVGLGLIGREHVRFIGASQRAELVAIADPTAQAKSEAGRMGVAHFDRYEDMLDRADIDAGIIAVPNQLHAETALACIARDIPALLEKPIATDIQSANAIVQASTARSCPILVGHHRRHSPDMRAARALIASGELGQMAAVSGMWMARKPDDYFDAEWRRQPGGGPALINLIHEIDCLRYLLGDVEQVQALTGNAIRKFAVEDTTALILKFVGGALGTFILCDAIPSPRFWDVASGQGAYFPFQQGNCFFLGGTRASLEIPSMQMWWHGPGEDWHSPVVGKTIDIERGNCYHNQMEHFIDVSRGDAEPLCSAQEGSLTLATTLAVGAAAEQGVQVDVMKFAAAGMSVDEVERAM